MLQGIPVTISNTSARKEDGIVIENLPNLVIPDLWLHFSLSSFTLSLFGDNEISEIISIPNETSPL